MLLRRVVLRPRQVRAETALEAIGKGNEVANDYVNGVLHMVSYTSHSFDGKSSHFQHLHADTKAIQHPAGIQRVGGCLEERLRNPPAGTAALGSRDALHRRYVDLPEGAQWVPEAIRRALNSVS